MRIAILCEDTAHEAVLEGLKLRWCPGAEMARGAFRGRTRQRRRAELYQEMERLFRREGCDCAVVLLDADTRAWMDAVEGERKRVPNEYRLRTAIGAPARNIECWLSADPKALADATGADVVQLRQARKGDPKGLVRAAFRRLSGEGGIGERELMVRFVWDADLTPWHQMSCFASFHGECQQLAARLECGPLLDERLSEE